MRKIRQFILLATILCITSCVNHINEEEETATVSFKISNYTQSGFSIAQSRTSISEVISHLSFAVYSKNSEKEQEFTQLSSNNDFGIIKASIPYGSHSILIVGHNGTEDAIINSPENITFKDNKITDTFSYYSSIEIDENTPASISIALDRVISKFELQATDEIPSGVKTIEFNFSGGGNSLNGTTEKSTTTLEQKKIIEIPTGYINTKNNKFVLYTFLPNDEASLTIMATAKNELQEVLFRKTFSDVPMKINRITRYKGEFFKTGENITGNITINNQWMDDFEQPF